MRDERRERRVDRYETIRALHQQGKSKSQIAKELGVSRWLVRRFVEAKQFPERVAKAPRRGILTPFEPLLQERWQAGERTTPALWRALEAAGYTGSIHTVRHWVQRRRVESAPHTNPAYREKYMVEPDQVAARAAAQRRLPGARQLVWLLINKRDELSDDDEQLLTVPLSEPSVATAYELGQRFLGWSVSESLASSTRGLRTARQARFLTSATSLRVCSRMMQLFALPSPYHGARGR
jgi:hypothetical protein